LPVNLRVQMVGRAVVNHLQSRMGKQFVHAAVGMRHIQRPRLFLRLLWLLPVAVLVATVAMASGIEGGTLFTPLFLLVLRLPAQQAAAAGLITEVFGFTSGLIAYQRR
jgi:hypothetical protein